MSDAFDVFVVEIRQRLNAIDYAIRKIQHDQMQTLLWISNTRKRMYEYGVYTDVGQFTASEPEPYRDGCPIITLKKKRKAGPPGA